MVLMRPGILLRRVCRSRVLEQLLGRRGHRVRVANTGRKVLALVDEGAFDLLLLDVPMPELDGACSSTATGSG